MNDRLRGTLIGLAAGDALGAAVEFNSPGSFAPVTGYRSGGPHGLKAGEWTDDTSMALALADSIATAGWDLNDQASRYVEWWKTGKYSVNGRCFDIGITTRTALSRFVASKDALTSGDSSEQASGNGSIMRLAPLPIAHAHLYPENIEELSRLADESSLPTHASEQCRSACRYLATILAALVSGEDRAGPAVCPNDECQARYEVDEGGCVAPEEDAEAEETVELDDDGAPLLESRRKEIFAALVRAQDQGMAIPASRREVAGRFGLTEDMVRDIEQEGLDNEWPPL